MARMLSRRAIIMETRKSGIKCGNMPRKLLVLHLDSVQGNNMFLSVRELMELYSRHMSSTTWEALGCIWIT